jgi:hypothetical protein
MRRDELIAWEIDYAIIFSLAAMYNLEQLNKMKNMISKTVGMKMKVSRSDQSVHCSHFRFVI